ncbi:hypothetical protein D7Z96_15820 [Pseudarthrobacter phenanthrenivorans]|uniref:Uncharacterized protein n=1 Tax=Pseudarthrobacter phenanthrenivorans TaxID=361575 RepID=A0A3B0FNT8_PSEPS|nr:hypothetical protein [Pseudarthrobacter phenanthrenivorans]RKO21560.1 hypothetical protein D7Z96_15820 [Pseudarthrobacter phenanthrenivorans]
MPEHAGHATSSRWDSVLDTLEVHLSSAQEPNQSAAAAVEPWSEPQDLGPLPARLAGRADRILRAQRQALIALEQAKEDTVKHLAALSAIPSVRPAQQSVYLDVEG